MDAKISIIVKPFLIHISIGNEFAILDRKQSEKGLQGITFSTPISSRDADIIDKSGIAHVARFTTSGTLAFSRKAFYDNSTMTDLIIDILKRHEAKHQPAQHLG